MPTPGDKRTAANPNPTQSGSFVYTNRLKTALLHWEAAYCADGYNHFTILELLRTDGGRAGFSVLLFQDIAVIPILALLPLLALPGLGTNDATEGSYAHAMTLVEGVTGWSYAGVVVAAVALVVLGGHFLSRPLFRFIAAARLREIFTATALLLVIGIALLMSLIDLSPALGTFLAGVVLANSEFRHELESDIEPFKGLLLGLFFITVGAGIDFGILADDFATVAGLTLGLMLGKGMVQYGLARLFRLTSTLRFPGERMIIHTASSIQVNLPLEEVFQYIAVDFFENYRKWSPEVTHLVKTCDAEMGIGVTGHQVRYDAGHRSEADFRVTHFLPLRELRCSSLTRPRFTVRYRFQAVAGGSRILFDFELEPELLMLPFRRLIDDAIRRGARRMLGNLKAALESDAAPAQYATPITAPGDGASVPRHQDLGDRGHD